MKLFVLQKLVWHCSFVSQGMLAASLPHSPAVQLALAQSVPWMQGFPGAILHAPAVVLAVHICPIGHTPAELHEHVGTVPLLPVSHFGARPPHSELLVHAHALSDPQVDPQWPALHCVDDKQAEHTSVVPDEGPHTLVVGLQSRFESHAAQTRGIDEEQTPLAHWVPTAQIVPIGLFAVQLPSRQK